MISESELQLPKPAFLAGPASLVHLECSCNRSEVWFDQLRLPGALAPYRGRPPVTIDELYSSGLTGDDIRAFLLDDVELTSGMRLTPVNLTWAMGYSWSSFVAQPPFCKVSSRMFCDRGTSFLPPTFVVSVCGALAVNTDGVSHFLSASIP